MGADNKKNLTASVETQNFTSLRKRAEEQVQANAAATQPHRTGPETQRLVHELEVHQIELEMQNAELAQARDEIESALDRYTDLYDFAPVGYLTLDREGAVQAANLTAAGLLGTERSRLIGRRLGLFVTDEARLSFSEFLGTIFTSEGKVSCEATLARDANAPLVVQIDAVAAASGVECRVAIVDITARKQAEEAVRISERVYRAIGETIDYGVWICAPDGRNRYASDSFLRLVGLTQEQCSDFGWGEVLHPDDVEHTIAAWGECVRTGGIWDVEHRFRGVDSQWHPILARGVPVRDEKGTVLCWAGINLDITALKRAEHELKKSHELLELKVIERTRDLNTSVEQLTHEVDERKRAEESLKVAYREISRLKDRLQAENVYLQQEVAQKHNFGEIIGKSPAISHVFLRVEQVAPMNATVLLLGETGTGKGLIASAIHSRSVRKGRPMITVNCSSLPANLIESELFGRERGAFTGAHDRQIGRFELADGGTIFLDEIGEMPLELQAKLLRVIQDGEFERLGGPRTIKVDVRIIAASNRILEEEIRTGRFREDLFYRLNVFPIMIPPLRQRPDDIPLLVTYFVTKFNKKTGKKIQNVSQETLNTLRDYHWPGNVRELESVIERAIITSQGTTLEVVDRLELSRKTVGMVGQDVRDLAEMEQHHILQVLQQTGWRIEGKDGAALLLGLNPSTLRARIRKYGIRRG